MTFKHLPPLLQQTLQTMQQINNVPAELAIQAMLGVVNFAVQARFNVDSVKFGIRPISCYFVGLAGTAKAKTTIYNLLKTGIDRFEDTERQRYRQELEDYQIDYDLYRDSYDRIRRSRETPQEKKRQIQALVKPRAPRGSLYRINKATVNGILTTLEQQPQCGLHSSEAGEFFSSHAFQDRTKAKSVEMTASLTSLWDGNQVDNITGMNKLQIANRRFNILFLLQTEVITEFLSDRIYAEQGFTHRLLISQSPDWQMPEFTLKNSQRDRQLLAQLEPFHRRIESLMQRPLRFVEDNDLELRPEVITMDTAAEALIESWVRDLDQRQEKYQAWSGFVNRAYEHCLRLAATLAVFEQDTAAVKYTAGDRLANLRLALTNQTPSSVTIDLAAAQAAVELMEFYLEQRLGLELGVRGDNHDVTDAYRLSEWIRSQGQVTQNNLTRLGPRWFRNRQLRDRIAIVDEMLSRGEIERVRDANGAHRPTVVYRPIVDDAAEQEDQQ